MVYGTEAWKLYERTCRMLNGVNVSILTHITVKSRHEEVSEDTSTFDMAK